MKDIPLEIVKGLTMLCIWVVIGSIALLISALATRAALSMISASCSVLR